MRLCGGKKKRKKKIYTKPKKIGHKHKKRPKAILEYFNVDNTGKIQKLKIECEKCPAGKTHSLQSLRPVAVFALRCEAARALVGGYIL